MKIRSVAQIPPRVSIVVPTYNSAAWLKPRLDSLADQSFRDVEILLFDDASKDESPEMLDAFAARHPQARVVVSETNSGSVFKAWERGIRASKGDFVWIAEADDWCEPDFLEHALRAFEPSGVRLVHGRSIPADQDGQISGDWNELYLDSIVPGLWHSSFCSPAAREVNRSLGRANSIVNASGVIVRRAAAVGAMDVARDFKLAGDWAFYVCAVHGGRMAYCHRGGELSPASHIQRHRFGRRDDELFPGADERRRHRADPVWGRREPRRRLPPTYRTRGAEVRLSQATA